MKKLVFFKILITFIANFVYLLLLVDIYCLFIVKKMPGKYKSEELRKLIVEAKQREEMDKDIAERYHCGRNRI